MAEYIRTKINYLNASGETVELGELSLAAWGEPDRLVGQIVKHYNLPSNEYDLYVMGPRDKPIKDLNPGDLRSVILVPRYSGPLIKP